MSVVVNCSYDVPVLMPHHKLNLLKWNFITGYNMSPQKYWIHASFQAYFPELLREWGLFSIFW